MPNLSTYEASVNIAPLTNRVVCWAHVRAWNPEQLDTLHPQILADRGGPLYHIRAADFTYHANPLGAYPPISAG